MKCRILPHQFSGTYRIPASKSHTIRRLLFASLAEGVSILEYPLDSLDTRSCMEVCRAFGAQIEEWYQDAEEASSVDNPNGPTPEGRYLARLEIKGVGGAAGLNTPEDVLNVGNSGTTLYLALAMAALHRGASVFTGDFQIRRRSAGPLLAALQGLGVEAYSTRDNGCAPIVIRGPWRGGRVRIECPTSQYLSALLIAAPLAPAGTITEIEVPLLNEKPYIDMTLSYLKTQGVFYEATPDYSFFRIPGGFSYHPLNGPVPGDFSSAAFPACAAAVSGGTVRLIGLNPKDTQGDRALFDMLKVMGCSVSWEEDALGPVVQVQAPADALQGGDFDLNATPDALPALAATAACGRGTTRLLNVPNARIKETDRIAVMAQELSRLGVQVQELADGLVIEGSAGMLTGGNVRGHHDHRVVMALALCGLVCKQPLIVDTAEAAAVTYPRFLSLLGAEIVE
ncbi:MAG: 3-phosphoshikimate 1-carboxyvinyltransferase [Treponemataceae bacterium]|nr:3-phosphoshikimate 1-carboxyvinyltransferase [Treponemataceae bacterium]